MIAAAASTEARCSRRFSEAIWTHCGWIPAAEYDGCPHTGQARRATDGCSGRAFRLDVAAAFRTLEAVLLVNDGGMECSRPARFPLLATADRAMVRADRAGNVCPLDALRELREPRSPR